MNYERTIHAVIIMLTITCSAKNSQRPTTVGIPVDEQPEYVSIQLQLMRYTEHPASVLLNSAELDLTLVHIVIIIIRLSVIVL